VEYDDPELADYQWIEDRELERRERDCNRDQGE
jgi:hypothetical protein